jgi:hypothetical protein
MSDREINRQHELQWHTAILDLHYTGCWLPVTSCARRCSVGALLNKRLDPTKPAPE